MKKWAVIFGLGGAALFYGTAFAYTSPGKPTGYVNDFAGVMTVEQTRTLNTELADFEKTRGHEIAVAIVPTLGDDTIENYSNQLFREWGVGDKKLNNGVLFVVAVNDRQMRIEVGYGLEGALTDIESKYILDEVVAPQFKAGRYAEGVAAGARKIEEAVQGEAVPVRSQDNNSAPPFKFWLYILLFVGYIFGLSKSWWLGGVVGGIAGIVAWLSFGFGWYFVPVGIFGGLLIDFIFSKGTFGGVFPGGFGGGIGGGGFGGFGGGSSGGGGSSSRW